MKAAPPLDSLQRHLAFAAIGPTTLRGMFDRPGCRKDICGFLATVDLADLSAGTVADTLDRWTAGLVEKTGYWGPSRKALNLFLRDAAYNHWVRQRYAFASFEDEFEVPLDGVVMKALRERDPELPVPPLVKRLKREVSEVFQRSASTMADAEGLSRVHLDLALWNGGLAGASEG